MIYQMRLLHSENTFSTNAFDKINVIFTIIAYRYFFVRRLSLNEIAKCILFIYSKL